MKVAYDPRLVEEAVHRLALADPKRWRHYRRCIDPLYSADDRDARLAAMMLRLFREWSAAKLCEEVLAPLAGVESALVARSRRPGDEGVDLLVEEERRTILVRLAAEHFEQPARLRGFLRHEVRHLRDMLDPEFGFRRDLGVHGRTRAETELVRSRYRVLWDTAIDALEPSWAPPSLRDEQLARAFAALAPDQVARLKHRFATERDLRRHDSLAAAARDPWAFLGVPRASGPVAGQPCPLCGFPTFDWDREPPETAIRADYPAWNAIEGACSQCADIYRVATTPGS